MTLSLDEYMATLARKRVGSGVLFTDAAAPMPGGPMSGNPTSGNPMSGGRVLLVEPTYKDHWEIPGGSVEADESPYDAAARELKEELDLAVTPGRLLVVDWVPAQSGRTEAVMFIYSGGVLAPDREGEIRLPADELRSWAWCSEAEAETRLTELLARRVRAAVRALAEGTMLYLENGRPIH